MDLWKAQRRSVNFTFTALLRTNTRIPEQLRRWGTDSLKEGEGVAGALGFEPRNDGIKNRCLTT
jgi:hypothetical protein